MNLPLHLTTVLAALVRADADEPSRYGEDPDPAVEGHALRRFAAQLAGKAFLEETVTGQQLGRGQADDYLLQVVDVAHVVPVQVAIVHHVEGTLLGVWPWVGAVEIEPREMAEIGLGSAVLSELERQASVMQVVAEEASCAGAVPWEELDPVAAGDGDESC